MRRALACRCQIEQYSMGRSAGPPTTAESTFRGHPRVERRRDMEDEHGMIPMGEPDEVEGPDGPPTVKMRNAAQQEVSRLLDMLAPERAAHRMGAKTVNVERHRTPRGCIL